jgi:hypothetical protein
MFKSSNSFFKSCSNGVSSNPQIPDDPTQILSDNLILEIFSYLDRNSSSGVSKVNKRWFRLANVCGLRKPDYCIKIALIANPDTNDKITASFKLCGDSYIYNSPDYSEFLLKYVTVNIKTVSMMFWNITLQERYRSLISPTFFRGSCAVLLVCAGTDDLAQLKGMVNIARETTNCPYYFVFAEKEFQCEGHQAAENKRLFAQEIGAKYLECSTQTGEGVKEILRTIADDFLRLIQDGYDFSDRTDSTTDIQITNDTIKSCTTSPVNCV